MRRLLVSGAVVVLAWAAGVAVMAQADPLVGTWKLNVAKSKFSDGVGPKSQTRTWGADGKVTVAGVNPAGTNVSYTLTIKPDGKAYPITGSAPMGADSVSTKRVDATTLDSTFTKAGKTIDTIRSMVSKDGKTLTLSVKGTQSNGKSLDDSLIFDRQ
jgi:hypothetical protein